MSGRRGRNFRGGEEALARRVLLEALEQRGIQLEDRDDLERASFLGEGLTYRAWRASCTAPAFARPGRRQGTVYLVARLPSAPVRTVQPELAEREHRLLLRLAELQSELDLPWRLPRSLACVPLERGVALVQHFVSGVELEMRASRTKVRPWELIAEVAARCHRIDPALLNGLLADPGSRRAHAEAAAATLLKCDLPPFREAHAWALEHLPPATPARLLHGDLLGQNLLRDLFEEDLPLGVIDWGEARLGDPAYELSIVTRGRTKPFQSATGLRDLLAAYNERAAEPISAADVHLHELCLLAGLYRQDRERDAREAHLEQSLNQFRGLLRRARQR